MFNKKLLSKDKHNIMLKKGDKIIRLHDIRNQRSIKLINLFDEFILAFSN